VPFLQWIAPADREAFRAEVIERMAQDTMNPRTPIPVATDFRG
jgi:hypothetical protein